MKCFKKYEISSRGRVSRNQKIPIKTRQKERGLLSKILRMRKHLLQGLEFMVTLRQAILPKLIQNLQDTLRIFCIPSLCHRFELSYHLNYIQMQIAGYAYPTFAVILTGISVWLDHIHQVCAVSKCAVRPLLPFTSILNGIFPDYVYSLCIFGQLCS